MGIAIIEGNKFRRGCAKGRIRKNRSHVGGRDDLRGGYKRKIRPKKELRGRVFVRSERRTLCPGAL